MPDIDDPILPEGIREMATLLGLNLVWAENMHGCWLVNLGDKSLGWNTVPEHVKSFEQWRNFLGSIRNAVT